MSHKRLSHQIHYILASDLTKTVRREPKGSAAQLKSKKRKQEQEAMDVMGENKNLKLKLENVTMEDIFEELRGKADELRQMDEMGQLTLLQKHTFVQKLRNITI